MPVITIQLHIPDEEVGTRVGVFTYYDGDDFEGTPELKLLGYGVYQGVFRLFDEDSNSQPCTESEDIIDEYRNSGKPPSPRIKLDTGEYIWGSFCYWDEEDIVRSLAKRSKVTQLDVEDFREEIRVGLSQYEDWKGVEKKINVSSFSFGEA